MGESPDIPSPLLMVPGAGRTSSPATQELSAANTDPRPAGDRRNRRTGPLPCAKCNYQFAVGIGPRSQRAVSKLETTNVTLTDRLSPSRSPERLNFNALAIPID